MDTRAEFDPRPSDSRAESCSKKRRDLEGGGDDHGLISRGALRSVKTKI